MARNTYTCFAVLTLAALTGCSSQPEAKKNPPPPRDKIQGRALVALNETSAMDAALNAGGPSVYLIDGLKRYRLFFNKSFTVEGAKEYTAEGVLAQKAIDAIGDPAGGKGGYPLAASCEHVVRTAWPGLAFDETDSYASSLRAKVNRFPARAVFLVTSIEPVADTGKKKADDEEKEPPKVTVPAAQQKALLVDGPTTLPAPLWEPNGGTAHCKVVVDEQGKIEELNSGAQLCETVPWSDFHYKPTMKGGKAIRVNTEVDVTFTPKQ